MAYTAWSVVFGEQPTAAKWNQLGQNDAGFKDGTNIDDNAIIARHINNGSVDANKLLLGADAEYAAGTVSTTSTSYVDLSGGPAVDVTIGVNGVLFVAWSAQLSSGSGNVSFRLSGANTMISDTDHFIYVNNFNISMGNVVLLTGLNAGLTTVTVQYKADSGTAQFLRRRINAVPLG